jgi:DNA repair protein RadD
MLHLRPYQAEAKAAVYRHLRARDDNPCVVIPTAGGKTPVIASLCKDAVTLWGGRVVVLAHVKELLEQAAAKLRAACPEVPFGVYSAGLRRRDTDAPVIVAGIQSAYRRACELDAFDLALVDEAHMIPAEGEGMYRQFLADARAVNPHLRVVGFTATAFRLKTGPICTPGGVLNAVCYEVGVRELIRDGYLSPLVSRAARASADASGLQVRGGEFVADQAEGLMDREALVRAACAEVVEHTRDRRSCLLFAAGVRHGTHVAQTLRDGHSVECGLVTAGTPPAERAALLEAFRSGGLKYLCNVNVLTTGFDAPNIDCVALLRPTASAGLYYQMVGRGFRLCPGKRDCLVLDFGGNVLRHGPVDRLRPEECDRGGKGKAPAKECPACHALVAAGYAVCPDCGHAFPPRERGRHRARPGEEEVLSAVVTTTTHPVGDVFYSVHRKRSADEGAPRTMRVDYKVGPNEFKSEWVCFEHTGYARLRAEAWWRRRCGGSVPATAKEAVDVANSGGVALTTAVTVRSVAGDPHERVIAYEVGPVPGEPGGDAEGEPADAALASSSAPDEVPF